MVNINEIKEGTLGNDPMYGGTGDDTLYGYSGIDTYVYNFGDGNDLIEDSDKSIFQFGEGIDLDDLEFETFDFQSGLIVTVKGSGTITIPDYFYIAGSKFVFADGTSFTTDNFPKFLTGSDGADKNTSMLAPNTFRNNDMIYGKGGDDSINGWAGDDLINGGAGNDNLIGSDGNDTLIGAEGSDTLLGGKGNDVYYVDSQAEDTLVEVLNEGIDTVISSASYSLGTNFDNLTLTDLAPNGTGNALANVIKGNTEDNLLDGDAGNDTLIGGYGNDTLIGGTGTDSMIGGEGNDVYFIDTTTDVISENSNAGIDTIISTISYNLGNNLENLNLIGSSNINAKGNSLANLIEGNDGNNNIDGGIGADTLIGGEGNDTLTGGTGADSMAGGLGDDTYYVDNALDITAEIADEGTDTVISSNNSYVLSDNIENLILSSLTAIGTGNDLANSITGNALSNVLDGGAGADTLTGGAGNDLYYVDDTADVIVEKLNEGLDEVISTAESFSLGSNVENVYLDGSAITAIGNSLANKITGNDEDNIFDAGIGNDTLTGGIGNDSMAGGVGNDIYIYNAGDGNDTISDLSGADIIQFGEDITFDKLSISGVEGGLLVEFLDEEDEVIDGDSITIVGSSVEKLKFSDGSVRDISTLKFGTDDDETLEGSTGNDTIVGAGGDDVLIGYAGNDTYYYNLGDGNDNISDTGANTYRFGEGITLADLDFAKSDSTNLIINFTDGGSITINEFFGKNTGSKFVFADGTTLDAGKFANLLSGDDDTDDVTGANYQSTLSGNNIIYSRGSNDNINGWAGDDLINGGEDDDYLSGGAGNDILFGGDGDDIIEGGAGSDTMAGGAGNDSYTVNVATDIIQENSDEGIDTVSTGINYSLGANVENLILSTPATNGTGNDLNNVITGNLLSNLISGREGDDTLDGGAGNDTLIGGTGADSMAGGLGNDVYFVDDLGDIVSENAGANSGTDTVISSRDYLMEDNIEKLNLTGSAIEGTGNDLANVIAGNSLDNIIDGGIGNDTLDGGAGNDTLIGGAGADSMAGGLGDDVYSVADITDKVTENLNAGNDTIISSQNYTLNANVENLTILDEAEIGTGNDLANVITGNLSNNLLSGGLGNDTLIGDEGEDTLIGGTGSDVLIGGLGNDTYYVDNSADKISENLDEGTDTVISSASYTLSENIENLNLTGTAISGKGNDLDNVITGNASNNLLDGAEGNDTLDGLGGADSMIGGLGNDTYYVDNAGDKISENLDEGTDTVISSVNYTLAPNAENLTITGSALIASGNTLANLITGNALNNSIDGKGGADTLIGDAGNDTYTFNKGYGQNLIIDTAGADTISFGAGIALGDLNVTQDVDDLVISLGGSDGITIKDWYAGNKIETFVMSNGTTYAGDYIAALSTASSGTSGNDTINGTDENDIIFGYEGDDLLTGGAENDYLYGSDGNDELNGEAGDDYLYGGAGNDTLEGEAGSDYLSGGTGSDNYYFAPDSNSGNDTISEEGSDIDSLEFSSGDESYVNGINVNLATGTISGLAEGHTITGDIKKIEDIIGTNFNDSLIGSSLGNYLDGSQGDDTIYGGAGNDALQGGLGNNRLYGEDGNDILLTDGEGTNYLDGGVGNDFLIGSEGVDTLVGGAGNDTLDGAGGNDSLVGGAGDDTYYIDNISGTDVIKENASEGVDTVISGVSFTLTDNVENLTLGRLFDDVSSDLGIIATGNALTNVIRGNNLDNIIDGKAGADTMYGGAGDDTYYIDGIGDKVFEISEADGNDTVISSLTYSLGANLENLTITGTAPNATGNDLANIIIGNTASNVINGGAGNDVLDGGIGNDTLIGGIGVDFMAGGVGNDSYIVDNTDDVITENSDDGTDYVSSSADYSLTANVENLTLTDSAISATGNDLANIITGNSLNNVISGGTGNDSLVGGAGNDIYSFSAGDGNDTITDISGNDTITLDDSVVDWNPLRVGNDLVIDYSADYLGNNNGISQITVKNQFGTPSTPVETIVVDNEVFSFNNSSIGTNSADTLNGTAADNFIIGNGGNDLLVDTLGNEYYYAGKGNDVITDSVGDDTYFFASGDGNDTITDSAGTDIIKLCWDIHQNEVTYEKNPDNLDLIINISDTDKITVKNWFADDKYKVEAIYSENNPDPIATKESIDALLGISSGEGTSENDVILTGTSDDTIAPGLGDDYIVDQGGNDLYNFVPVEFDDDGNFINNDGSDTITDFGGNDTIVLENTSIADVKFAMNANNLEISAVSTSLTAKITVKDWAVSPDNRIETLAFNNIIHNPDLLASLEESQSNFALIDAFFENTTVLNNLQNLKLGTAATTETITCFADNDVIISGTGKDTINGGAGDDTYIFSLGDGIKTIIDASGSDRIILSNFSDYGLNVFVRTGDDLLASFDATNKFTVKNWFLNNTNKIEALEFADIGIKVDLTNYTIGTDSADTLTGSANGSVIYDNKGNDQIIGLSSNDTYISGAGNDTINDAGGDDYYTFMTGNGQDVINDAAGDDTILINTTSSFNDNDKSNFTRSGNDLTVKYKNDGTDQVTIKGWFDNSANKIENFDIRASNGHFEVTSSEIDALYEGYSVKNNAANQNFTLTSNDDAVVYNINGGFDTITDLGGNDTLTVNGYDVYNDVDFFKEGNNLKIEFQPNDTITGSVTIKDWTVNKIENLVFNYDSVNTVITGDMLVVGAATGNTTVSASSTDSFLKSSTANNLIITHNGNDNITDPGGNDMIFAGAGNDIITDTAGNDTICGGEGNDNITDNAGNDLYVYNKGDGRDVITDLAGTDTISFRDNITSHDISFVAGGIASGVSGTAITDLIIGIGEMQDTINGGAVVVKDFFNYAKPNSKIEAIEFSDSEKILLKGGVTSGIDAISDTIGENYVYISGAGNDTITDTIGGNDIYVINQGDGKDVIADKFGDDTLYLTGAISDSVHFEKSGTGDKDLLIKFKTVQSTFLTDTVTVKNWFSGEGEDDNRIETISLSDGTEVTPEDVDYYISNGHLSTGSTLPGATEQDDTLQGTSDKDYINGLAGNDLIYGGGMADTIIGGLGNDTLVGGAGTDIYVFLPGDGQDVIIENEQVPNVIAFGGCIIPADIIFTKDGTSLIVSIDGTEDSMTLTGWFNDQGGFANTSVTFFQFNGEPLPRDVQYVFDNLGGNNGGDLTPNNGTDGNDTLTDPLDIDVIFTGGLGDDLLIGGAGCDTYVFNRNDGNDIIIETAPGDEFGHNIDTIQFGTGIIRNDLTFANNNNDLLVTVNNGGGTITVKNWFDGSQHGGADMNVEIFAFVDDPNNSLNPQQVQAIINGQGQQEGGTINGNGDDNNIPGSPYNDNIWGQGGNDTINGNGGIDEIECQDGNDTYLFNRGNGVNIICDNGGTDTIKFGAGITVSDLEFGRMADDMVISLYSGGQNTDEKVIIQNYFAWPNAPVESITFTEAGQDPIVVSTKDAEANANILGLEFVGTAGNDTIVGSVDWDGDTIIGGQGNDYFYGRGGLDVYKFAAGDGNDTIVAGSGFGHTVKFAAESNITHQDIQFIQSNNDLIINYGENDSIFVSGGLDTMPCMNKIDHIVFSDETSIVWDMQSQNWIDGANDTVNEHLITATNGNDFISGTPLNDTIISGKGIDVISDVGGDDLYQFNLGDGQKIIGDTNGDDTISFGEGISIDDLSFKSYQQNDHDDLRIFVNGTQDQIAIDYYYEEVGEPPFSEQLYAIETLKFADGSSVALSDYAYSINNPSLEPLSLPDLSTAGNDTILGSEVGDYMEDLLGGDDTYFGYTGIDMISDNAGNDTVYLTKLPTGGGLTRNDLDFSQVGNHLLIQYKTESGYWGHYTTILDWFLGDTFKIEKFVIGDDTISSNAVNYYLTNGNLTDYVSEVTYGTAANDNIIGGAGNDTLIGGKGDDLLVGEEGNDLYLYSIGDGNDNIVDSQGSDTICFDSNISVNDIGLIRYGNELIINDLLTGDMIDIHNYYNDTINGINSIAFEKDNVVLNVADIANTLTSINAVMGTTGDNLINDLTQAPYIIGLAGNDVIATDKADGAYINGGSGNDGITGGTGNDTIVGGAGNDNLDGGAGNDLYITGNGNDVIYDAGGDDTFVFADVPSVSCVNTAHDSSDNHDKIILESINHEDIVFAFHESINGDSTSGVTMLLEGGNVQLYVDREVGGNVVEHDYRGVEQIICSQANGEDYYITRDEIALVCQEMAAYVGGQSNLNAMELTDVENNAELMTIISNAKLASSYIIQIK